jgi:creatinine amidohydrolase
MGERIGKRSNVIVVPTLPFGYNPYHTDFPGCIHIPQQHLTDLYLDICRALYKYGIRRLIFLSPHAGNASAILDAAFRLREENGMLSAFVSYELAGKVKPDLEAYASEGLADETAMMLYLKPATAHPERGGWQEFKNVYGPKIKTVGSRKFSFGKGEITIYSTSKDISDTCGWSSTAKGRDMTNATRELGENIIETAVNYIVEFIDEFKKVKLPPAPN